MVKSLCLIEQYNYGIVLVFDWTVYGIVLVFDWTVYGKVLVFD